MPFYFFGPTKGSWATGNSLFTAHHELSPNLTLAFNNQTLTGNNIGWGSIGPEGICCIYLELTNQFYSTQTANLQADIAGECIKQLSFSPQGGWFIKYADGRVRLSMNGAFPETFHTICKQQKFFETKGALASARQYSSVNKVFFGANDAVLITYDGGIQWQNIHPLFEAKIRERHAEGWQLTERTQLCHWNKNFFFAEWTKPYTNQYLWSWKVPHSGIMQDVFLREIMEGKYPVSHNIPKKQINNGDIPDLPEAAKKVLKDLFDQAMKEEGRNYLNPEESKQLLTCLGEEFSTSKEDLAKIWELSDADSNGCLEFEEAEFAFWLLVSRAEGLQLPTQKLVLPNRPIKNNLPPLPERKVPPPLPARKKEPQVEVIAVDLDAGQEKIDRNGLAKMYCTTCMKAISGKYFHCNTCAYGGGSANMCVACNESGVKCRGSLPQYPHWLVIETAAVDATPNTDLDRSLQGLNLTSGSDNKPIQGSTPASEPSLEYLISQGLLEEDKPAPEKVRQPPQRSTNPFASDDHQGNNTPDGGKDADHSSRNAQDKQLRSALEASIVREKPNVEWDDVAGLEAAKEELQEAVVLPIKFPQMFTGNRKARKGILLYGPPGTGKSYLAKAVATEVDSTLFSISSGDIMSKWTGESERLVKTLFSLARENKPSIIFIDELDALCGNRDNPGNDESSARVKTEILVQMDGVGHDNTGVLLLAATNLPWTLDPAVRRRFQKKIHIPLPDEEARKRMFEIHVGDIPSGLVPADYEELARQTEGLSGSDISIAVQDALMQPVKKISSSKHWKAVNHNGTQKLTPCLPHEEGAVPLTWRKVPASKLLEPTLLAEDFFNVLKGVKPSVAEAEILKCREWTEQFGVEGA